MSVSRRREDVLLLIFGYLFEVFFWMVSPDLSSVLEG